MADVSFDQLVEALDRLEDECSTSNQSFPDALREALTAVAERRGSSDALVRTRPGCWEADHIRALASLADPWPT